MTQQRTSFFRVDGHRIGYATVGEGPPLVLPAWWVSNVVEDWKEERIRAFFEPLTAYRQVIRYDRLGCGISDRVRPAETLSVQFETRTLGALLEHLGLDQVTLVGGSWGGCTAISYARRHPERVDGVVLYGTYANGSALLPSNAREALIELVRAHWGLGSRMLADAYVPSGGSAARDAFAAFQRRSASAEMAAALLEMVFSTDVREDAVSLQVPALIVHRRGDRVIPARSGEELAALIPNAKLALLEGDAHFPWVDGGQDVLAAMASFVGLPERQAIDAIKIKELSARERDVLRLVAEGCTDAEIARRLVLSPHTVHRHVANILRKLGLRSRSAAAAAAARAGLI